MQANPVPNKPPLDARPKGCFKLATVSNDTIRCVQSLKNITCDDNHWCQSIDTVNDKTKISLSKTNWLVVELEFNPTADTTWYNSKMLDRGELYLKIL